MRYDEISEVLTNLGFEGTSVKIKYYKCFRATVTLPKYDDIKEVTVSFQNGIYYGTYCYVKVTTDSKEEFSEKLNELLYRMEIEFKKLNLAMHVVLDDLKIIHTINSWRLSENDNG